MNNKGNFFSLIALSGTMLFSFAIIGKNFDFSGARATGGISEPIISSVVFTRNDTFKTIGTYKYSVKSRTPNNTDVYAITDCKTAFSSSYIASFPSISDTDYETKIYFSEDENGQKPFLFQKVSDIEFTFNSGSANICIGSFSGTDYEYDNFESFESGVSKEINHTANKEVRIKGPTKENRQLITRPVKSIELVFTCDYNYIPPVEHNVRAASTINGSIQLQQTTAFKDDEIKFTIIPDSGYYASSVSTSNPDVVPELHDSYYSFIMPDENIEIRATFEIIPIVDYTVSANNSEHGEIVLYETLYHAGDTVNFMLDIDEGYCVDELYTSPSCLISGSDGLYSFSMPASDVVINASFVITYSISINPDIEHGSVSVDKSQCAAGKNVVVSVNPEQYFEISSVSYNRTPISPVNDVYSFVMPSENVTVSAQFITHYLHVDVDSSIEHGSISLSEDYYNSGDKVEFTVTPDKNYEVNVVSVSSGAEVTNEGDGVYSFIMPSSNVEVSATFKNQTVIFDPYLLLSEMGTFRLNEVSSPSYFLEFTLNHDKTGTQYGYKIPSTYQTFSFDFELIESATDEFVYYVSVSNVQSVSKGMLGFSIGVDKLKNGQTSTEYFKIKFDSSKTAIEDIEVSSYNMATYIFKLN